MSEKTVLGLGVLGVAVVLGAIGDLWLRATPWGINVFLFFVALAGLRRWRRGDWWGSGERGPGW